MTNPEMIFSIVIARSDSYVAIFPSPIDRDEGFHYSMRKNARTGMSALRLSRYFGGVYAIVADTNKLCEPAPNNALRRNNDYL